MTEDVEAAELTLADVQLVHIGLNQINGQQFLVGDIDDVNLRTETKFAVEGESLIFLVSNGLDLNGPLGEMVALSATAVAIFKAPRALSEADQNLVSEVGGATLMITQPVLREAISDLANKLGLPRVTLGLLRFGHERPESVTIGEKIYSFDQQNGDDSIEVE